MAAEPGERLSIFRAQALEHHRRGRWTEVLPPSARPRVFRWLWLALGVLGLLLLGVAAVPVPAYGSGSALAVAGSAVGQPAEPVAVVIVLPLADLSDLTDGATVVLQQGSIRGTVTGHESAGMSRAELTSRFGLPSAVTAGVPDPAAVAVVRLDAGASTVDIGNRYPAQVRVGAHSVLAGVPVLGRIFG